MCINGPSVGRNKRRGPSFAKNSLLSGDARKSGFLESWRVRATQRQSMIYSTVHVHVGIGRIQEVCQEKHLVGVLCKVDYASVSLFVSMN